MHTLLWPYLWEAIGIIAAASALVGWFAHVIWEEYHRTPEVTWNPLAHRTARDLDDSRYREASPHDGAWRGVRWLPVEDHHEERR